MYSWRKVQPHVVLLCHTCVRCGAWGGGEQEPSTDAVWDASVIAARKLQRVLVAFSPPATSAEVRLVNEGLRGLVKESEARCLIAAYRSIRMQGELEEEQTGLQVLEAALPLL